MHTRTHGNQGVLGMVQVLIKSRASPMICTFVTFPGRVMSEGLVWVSEG